MTVSEPRDIARALRVATFVRGQEQGEHGHGYVCPGRVCAGGGWRVTGGGWRVWEDSDVRDRDGLVVTAGLDKGKVVACERLLRDNRLDKRLQHARVDHVADTPTVDGLHDGKSQGNQCD